MRFAIDVAFVHDENGGLCVVALREGVRPFRLACVRGSPKSNIAALELAAGEACRLGLHPGSSLPAARFL